MNLKEIISGHAVEYFEGQHRYVVDGQIIPSVSDLCKKAYPNRYKGINQNILAHSIKRGNYLHNQIESFEKHNVMGSSIEFKNYLKIKETLGFDVKQTETMVLIKYQNQVIACGRFDLLVEINNELVLIDIKRTRDYHEKSFTLQLNLYRYGFMQNNPKPITALKVLRLRDSEAQVLEIPIDESLVEEILQKYVKPQFELITDEPVQNTQTILTKQDKQPILMVWIGLGILIGQFLLYYYLVKF